MNPGAAVLMQATQQLAELAQSLTTEGEIITGKNVQDNLAQLVDILGGSFALLAMALAGELEVTVVDAADLNGGITEV